VVKPDLQFIHANKNTPAVTWIGHATFLVQMANVTPEEAVQIHKDLGIKRSIGMHGGTFAMGEERLDQPLDDLEAARKKLGVKEDEFFVLKRGETFRVRNANEAIDQKRAASN
jgi:L-ascorbate metabolism protein UlaG (beta-lactamase superfamily)